MQQKLELLYQWQKRQKVTREAFEHFSNLWINKESKKERNLASLYPARRENFERTCPYSAVEGEMQSFIDRLRSYINEYISSRYIPVAALNEDEIKIFKKYVTQYFAIYPAKIDRLLILGLRYPDESKAINKFCSDWIAKNSLMLTKDYYNDPHFWGLLWEDGNLVPLDAIRLMLVKKGNDYEINPRFNPRHIQTLIPYITAQRDKEITRLKLAQMRDDRDHETQVKRKTKRLNAFNVLLDAAERYCAAL